MLVHEQTKRYESSSVVQAPGVRSGEEMRQVSAERTSFGEEPIRRVTVIGGGDKILKMLMPGY